MIVGGYVDHVHLLVRIPAKVAVSKFVGELKANCSKHINATSGLIHKFNWQDGFGAFTVSPSQKTRVCSYIEHQAEHHAREKFETEYIRLLDAHEVEYEREYVFD